MHDIKHWMRNFPMETFSAIFWGNFITYWFNFSGEALCEIEFALPLTRWLLLGRNWIELVPATSPVKILSINIGHQFRPYMCYQYVEYPPINQSINQHPSIFPCWNRIEVVPPVPRKYYPPISAICSFKTKITTIRIKNLKSGTWMNWFEKQGASPLPWPTFVTRYLDLPLEGKDRKTTATKSFC